MQANDESKRRIKQKYLHEQIIENSMDPDSFSSYLSNLREDGNISRHKHW